MGVTNTVATEYTLELAHTPIDGSLHGKVRRKVFNHTFTLAADATSTCKLCALPKGAVFVGGKIVYEALGAAVTGSVGDGTTADKFGTLTSMVADGSQFIGNKVANFGQKVIDGCVVTLTTADQAISAGKKIAGYIDYILP